jgi:hypothetical protein
MSSQLILLLCLGIALVALAVWAMWPPAKTRPGPANNWQQRDGTEVFSEEDAEVNDTIGPVTVAIGTGGTGVF